MMTSVTMVTGIQIAPELWHSNMMPEGILERWLKPDGIQVEAGDPVAVVRIEDARHELMAPARGRLKREIGVNSVVEPGMAIGSIVRNIAKRPA